jgi:hypothetical protein
MKARLEHADKGIFRPGKHNSLVIRYHWPVKPNTDAVFCHAWQRDEPTNLSQRCSHFRTNALQLPPRAPRPTDPLQLLCRARLGAASKRYSQGLTDGRQNAGISRPRHFQSGPLTGQQIAVRQECATKGAGTVAKPL